jgi:HTH-type transcriptional regulator/antitoxin MqsA
MPHAYKGDVTTIPAVTGDFCPACGEAILDMTEGARVSALMMEFNNSRPA